MIHLNLLLIRYLSDSLSLLESLVRRCCVPFKIARENKQTDFELFIINQESQGVCVCACAGDRGSSYVLCACRCVAVRELGGGVGVVRTSREVGVAVVKSTPSREGDPTTDNRGVTLVGAANIRRGVRGPSLPAYIRRWVEVILSLSRCVPARLPLGDVGIRVVWRGCVGLWYCT